MDSAFWAYLTIEELVRLGVDYFFISPGSRSTPLVLAIDKLSDKCQFSIHFDERAMAFMALGWAKASGKPAVLVCTSGSAVANYLPAVVEAYQQGIPLILLTADRPDRLLNCGANQAINQRGIFANYVCAEINITSPNLQSNANDLLYNIDNIYYKSVNLNSPVHINCQYDEPFFRTDTFDDIVSDCGLLNWLYNFKPLAKQEIKPKIISVDNIKQIVEILQGKQILIIAGRMRNELEAEAVINFAKYINAPCCADITSYARFNTQCICYFDFIIKQKVLKPDVILHFGGGFISKALLEYSTNLKVTYIHIDNSNLAYNPENQVSVDLRGDIVKCCQSLQNNCLKNNFKFYESWLRCEDNIAKRLQGWIAKNTFSEIAIVKKICDCLTAQDALVIGASMPVRLVNLLAKTRRDIFVPVSSNRGASGIDGNIATAVGWAKYWQKRTILLIGDLTFLHDATSLSLISKLVHPVLIIVLNNNGGAIFNYLPIAKHIKDKSKFNALFSTPHNYQSFQYMATQFNLDYIQPKSIEQLSQVLTQASQSTLVEISLDADVEYKNYQNCFKDVANV